VRAGVLDLAVDHDGHRRDRQNRQRRAPPPRKRHGEAEHNEPVDPAGDAHRLEHCFELGGDHQRERDERVDRRRRETRPLHRAHATAAPDV
jgi:hypothetical protein